MKTRDVVIGVGVGILILFLLKRSGLAQGGGAGAHGGGTAGGGCGCGGSPPSSNPRCPSASPGYGTYAQGAGPVPPEAFTNYNPPGSDNDYEGFHLGFDLSIGL
jgi:hypothetical protein